jgi:hypothetical protein
MVNWAAYEFARDSVPGATNPANTKFKELKPSHPWLKAANVLTKAAPVMRYEVGW